MHQGSQWHGSDVWWTKSARQNATGERYVDISELIRYTCTRCAEEGLEGLEIQVRGIPHPERVKSIIDECRRNAHRPHGAGPDRTSTPG